MRKIWNGVNERNISKEMKNRLYLVSLVLVNMLPGALVWFTVGRLFLPEIEWFLCFVGYPAVFFGFFGGVLYLYNHEFS